MSIAPNSASASRSASTVRWEKPQTGASGVPFMKSMTRLLAMAWSIASAIWASVTMFMASSAAVTVFIDSAWIEPSSSMSCTAA